MNIGLCGTSNIAKVYIKCFRKLGKSIQLVYGTDLERLKNFAKINKIPNYTNNVNDLKKEKNINSYIIANEPNKHLDIARILFNTNKNLLIEKPIDVSLKKIDHFYKLTKNKKNIIHVVNQNRFDISLINLKKKIQNLISHNGTKFGNLNLFYKKDRSYFFSGNNWKVNYSSPLINQGIHFLDILIWIFGDFLEVKSIIKKDNKELKMHDNIAGVIRFQNDVLINIFASTSIKKSEIKFEFYSNKNQIKYKQNDLSKKLNKIFFYKKNQFDLFYDQCKLFLYSIECNDKSNNNILDAYKAVKLAKKLSKLND